MTAKRLFLYIFLVVLVLICLSPLAAVIWSTDFAERNGCSLNEGGVHSCIVNGEDWGPTLYSAFVSGWFALATLPIAAIAAIAFLIMAVFDLIHYIRSRSKV